MKALLLGATGGVGIAIAKKLAASYELILQYCKDTETKNVLEKELEKKKATFSFHQVNVLDENEWKLFLQKKEIGDADVLIHALSLPIEYAEVSKLPWKRVEEHLHVQVKTLLEAVAAVAPHMKQQKNGKIICISTEYAIGRPPERVAEYVIAKYALVGACKSLAVELGRYNIVTNCVAPGIMHTKLTTKVPSKLFEIVEQQTPLKKITTPEEVAELVFFLCNTTIALNGEHILLNGGNVIS